MGKNEPVFYILGSTKPLDYFKTEGDQIFTNTIDKLLYSFPNLAEANLHGYTRDTGKVKKRAGLILGVDKNNLTFVTYDKNLDFCWNWQPVTRGLLERVFHNLVQNTLVLPYKTNERIEPRRLQAGSPYIVVVMSRELSNKGNPTARKFDEFVLKHCPDAKTTLLYEEGRWPQLLLAEHGLSPSVPLDNARGKNAAVLDERVRRIGQKYQAKMRTTDRENQ